MTRNISMILAVAITCTLFGCAAEGTVGDDVAVLTADLDDEHFELVEVRGDGFIDVEIYYSAGQAEEVVTGVFRWPEVDPTPTELVEMLAGIPARVITLATPIVLEGEGSVSDETVSVNAVWPRLLVETRLMRDDRNLGFDCDETSGLSDCLQAR